MSYTVSCPTEVRWASAGSCGKEADEARENIADRNKTFLLNGSGSADWDLCFPSPRAHGVEEGEDATAFKMQQSTPAGEAACARVCL